MVSWYFALAQIAIEALGWIISIMVWLQQRKEEDMSPEAQEEKFKGYSQDVNGQLSSLTPKFNLAGP
jgi:hypothetical protein